MKKQRGRCHHGPGEPSRAPLPAGLISRCVCTHFQLIPLCGFFSRLMVMIKTIPTAALHFPACAGWCRADVCPRLFLSIRSPDAPGAAAGAGEGGICCVSGSKTGAGLRCW